jgi:hypothetical protein
MDQVCKPILRQRRRFDKPRFRVRRRAAGWQARTDLVGPAGRPDVSAFEWLEPEEYPAWRRRLELERRAHNLTPARRDCLRALLAFVGEAGLFPSDAAVAELAGHGVRTVQRARDDARELGLLTWERTRRLVDGRWRQGPNRYTIAIPDRLVCPGGQDGRRVRKKEEKKHPGSERVAPLAVPPGLPSLAEIAQSRQAALVAAWQERRNQTGVRRVTAGTLGVPILTT